LKLTKGEKREERIVQSLYQSAVGSLLYLSTGTRVDITLAFGYVARYSSDPTATRWLLNEFLDTSRVQLISDYCSQAVVSRFAQDIQTETVLGTWKTCDPLLGIYFVFSGPESAGKAKSRLQ